jgi:uncharacterized MAPEG superfamily protein
MVELIAYTALLYLVQLMLPNFLKKDSEHRETAAKAVKNLQESLPVFFTLAVLSIVQGADVNLSLAFYWLLSRVLFVVLYVTGLGRKVKPVEESDYPPQMIRSLVWAGSIALLISMTINLIQSI